MSHRAATSSLAEDLAWNRRGYIAPAQRAALDRAASVPIASGTVMQALVGCLLGLVAAATAMLPALRPGGEHAVAALMSLALLLAFTLVWAAMLPRAAIRRAALRSDIAAGQVVALAGRVAWRAGISRNDYALEPTDGTPPVLAGWAPLPPGPYRAYCLPRSRIVIAAESTVIPGGVWSISLADAKQMGTSFHFTRSAGRVFAEPFSAAPHIGDRVEPLRAMAAALDFDAEDLGHNQRGTMSPRQVRRRLASAAIPFVLITSIGLVPATLVTVALRLYPSILVIPFLLAAIICLRLRRDVFTRRVRCVEGVVERHRINPVTAGELASRYRLLIHGDRIPVPKKVFRAIVPKLRYRLYLCESTGRALSAELVGAPSTHPRGAAGADEVVPPQWPAVSPEGMPSWLVDDIARNRAGRLSAAQRALLERLVSVRRLLEAALTAMVFAAVLLPLSQSDLRGSLAIQLICAFLAAGGLAVMWTQVRVGRLRDLLRADIAAGDVVVLPGRVVWRARRFGSDYVMEPVDGSAPVHASAAPLPPGPYRGYLLPRSRLLIAAESTVVPGGAWSISLGIPDGRLELFHGRAGTTALAQPFPLAPHIGDRAELLRALAGALRFNAKDLEHNRRGVMSPRQVRRRLLSPFGILAAAAFAVAVPALFEYASKRRVPLEFIGLAAVGAVLYYLWAIRDLFTRRVATVDGVVRRHLEIRPSSYESRQWEHVHYLAVEQRLFKVKEQAYRALVPDLPYRIYVTERTGTLLSVDPLAAPSTHPRGAPRPEATWKET
ncbi:hypothetical protein WMF37_47025 [Sorangium sp. So ce291]|uniref:hypothetical protein n=1 Tax=Sorangium sp. So ce291 TaxID=3133294 RepID=UPI003F5DF233